MPTDRPSRSNKTLVKATAATTRRDAGVVQIAQLLHEDPVLVFASFEFDQDLPTIVSGPFSDVSARSGMLAVLGAFLQGLHVISVGSLVQMCRVVASHI